MKASELKSGDNHIIRSDSELRSRYGKTHDIAVKKCLTELDTYSKEYISRSPFICLSTQHVDGAADVSPRGDPAGFVRVLDETTLAIPDRPGNNRLDSLSNIISNPMIGLLFIVPGFDDTLRINGKAFLSENPLLLNSMSVNGRAPKLAIVVEVDEIFLHCAKAFRRARLWEAESWQDRSELPSLAAMVTEQVSGVATDPEKAEQMAADLEEEYQSTMY